MLGPLAEEAAAIVANFGTEASALAAVLFGEAAPGGRLPFDMPRSMDPVLASRTDVPFGTVDPTFRFGHGLTY